MTIQMSKDPSQLLQTGTKQDSRKLTPRSRSKSVPPREQAAISKAAVPKAVQQSKF